MIRKRKRKDVSVKGDATEALCEIGPQPIDRPKVSTTGTVSHSPAENVNNLAETTLDISSESFVSRCFELYIQHLRFKKYIVKKHKRIKHKMHYYLRA